MGITRTVRTVAILLTMGLACVETDEIRFVDEGSDAPSISQESSGGATDAHIFRPGASGSADVLLPLFVEQPRAVLNEYRPLAESALGGEQALRLSRGADWADGSLVVVWQTAVTSSQYASEVGRFEFNRVATSTGSELSLSQPLQFSYRSPGAQAVLVPEWLSVTMDDEASISAQPWNGVEGGVAIVLARGAVEGTIDVDGLGFRGGAEVLSGEVVGFCDAYTETAPSRGARKGEGMVLRPYLSDEVGRGNASNGGGGGVCARAGGGGGGSSGVGGQGGNSSNWDDSRPVGGQGGESVPLGDLWLGGGGGGGHGMGNIDADRRGGAGGGAILVIAARFAGRLSARGADGLDSSDNAVGGGGGGGVVWLDVDATGPCLADVVGGNGGSLTTHDNAAYGPGGGGGGGRVTLSASHNCESRIAGGDHGVLNGERAYGAAPGAAGLVRRLE